MDANMQCLACKFVGDEATDFHPTDIPGERRCPKCSSLECHMLDWSAIDESDEPSEPDEEDEGDDQ